MGARVAAVGFGVKFIPGGVLWPGLSVVWKSIVDVGPAIPKQEVERVAEDIAQIRPINPVMNTRRGPIAGLIPFPFIVFPHLCSRL
jgi:hypothetical protein